MITKIEFKDFLERYYIGGILNKVKWKYFSTEKKLHVRAVADNKAFIGDVVWNNFSYLGPDQLTICIGDTERLKSLLSPFNGDIILKINKMGDRILGFSISDNDCESYCPAADPSVIDPVPKNINEIPDGEVEVPLSPEFLSKFLKAKMALKDVDSFSVGMNKKGLFEIVIGYTTSNSSRIRLTPTTNAGKDKLNVALTFPIKNIYEVLKANEDISDGILSINEMGIARLQFKSKEYDLNYYQFSNIKS